MDQIALFHLSLHAGPSLFLLRRALVSLTPLTHMLFFSRSWLFVILSPAQGLSQSYTSHSCALLFKVVAFCNSKHMSY